MKKTDLLEALGDVNGKYLNEAQERAEKTELSFEAENIVMGVEIMNKTSIWRKAAPTAAVAAAFILVVGTVVYMGKGNDFREEASSGENLSASESSNSAPDNNTSSAILIQSIDEQNTAEAILDKNYENLTFAEDFIVEFPEIDSFETFTMTSKPGLSGQEVYDLFDAAVDKYFPDTFTEEEKKELYYATATNADGEIISGDFEQHKEDFLRENAAPLVMLLNSEKGMIQMVGNGGIQTITGTAAFHLDDSEHKTVGMYCAADNNTVLERIHIPQSGHESDMEYDLLDGSVKLTDAIAYTEDILTNDFNEENANPELIPDVYDAWVVDMGDGIYGYHFTMTHTYNNIRFDAQPMREATSTHRLNDDCKPYSNYPGYAFTIENEKLDSVMIVGTKLAYDISDVQTHDSMITAEMAADILSRSISGSAGLVIERAEFMYTPYEETEGDNTSLIVDAAWRFVGSNTNDGYSYLFYVNAVTGEFDYYRYS